MKKGTIFFFEEGINFKLPRKRKTKDWIEEIIRREKKAIGNLNFIFCNDFYLHEVNLKYLNHDTLTDIITFDLSEFPDEVGGDIFISIDRVKENSKAFNCSFTHEINRVMSHGVLHLIGYNDKTNDDALIIRQKEDYYLSLLPIFILE